MEKKNQNPFIAWMQNLIFSRELKEDYEKMLKRYNQKIVENKEYLTRAALITKEIQTYQHYNDALDKVFLNDELSLSGPMRKSVLDVMKPIFHPDNETIKLDEPVKQKATKLKSIFAENSYVSKKALKGEMENIRSHYKELLKDNREVKKEIDDKKNTLGDYKKLEAFNEKLFCNPDLKNVKLEDRAKIFDSIQEVYAKDLGIVSKTRLLSMRHRGAKEEVAEQKKDAKAQEKKNNDKEQKKENKKGKKKGGKTR